jgi:tetratricopeptide (TPR) repeat protein
MSSVTKRSIHARELVLALALISILGVGIGAVVVRWVQPTVPTLDEVRALARSGQFSRGRAVLREYLKGYPNDKAGYLLMAELATEPSSPEAELALEALGHVHAQNRRLRAVVKFLEGKARYQQKRYDLAETCWWEALAIDPLVPEAGWALLDLLDLEGRVQEAHALGMKQHLIEPDPRDRVRYLLELSRLDIDQVAPGSQFQIFQPLHETNPQDVRIALILGRALIHDSRPEEGLKVLREVFQRHPESPEVWRAWLEGLYDGHEFEELAQAYKQLPESMRSDPRFARIEGLVAENAQDWPRAIAAFRRARAYEPYEGVVSYHLRQALIVAGQREEAERVNREYANFQAAFKQLRGVYQEALKTPTLGYKPHVELYQKLADLREKMGRVDEARAWHRLVLEDEPENAISVAALERLK